MTGTVKTIVATGVSSGLGLEAIRQLLTQTQPYRIILGARDVARTQKAYDAIDYVRSSHSVSVLPLELANLQEVKSFATQVLAELGTAKIDYLLLNAAITNPSEEKNRFGSQWCESYVVNHLAGHYLIYQLQDKLVESKARVVFVSSGAIRRVDDPSVIESEVRAGSGVDGVNTYSNTKFAQLLGAHWWRRRLTGKCDVVAVSPGLIPSTGIFRGSGFKLPADAPDAKPVPEGARSILQALVRDDFPENPDQIFLTSWGEWWGTDVIEKTLDKELQDKFCPSKEELESEEKID